MPAQQKEMQVIEEKEIRNRCKLNDKEAVASKEVEWVKHRDIYVQLFLDDQTWRGGFRKMILK